MINKITLISFLFISFLGISQKKTCGFDQAHKELLESDPAFKERTDAFESYIVNHARDFKTKLNGTYKIPIVVHVMDAKNEISSISDDEIRNAIKQLNERFRKITGTPGAGNGVDATIEFVLAVRNPSGSCTNGIVRVDMSGNATYVKDGVKRSASGITDASLKAISGWTRSKYYNIWLVSEIDGNNGGYGTQGYAFFASSHGYSNDGAVMSINTFKDPTSVTLTHELGHAFNLYHTFEGDEDNNGNSICPTNTNCSTQGDRVCDTPPHKRSASDCVVGTNACDGGSTTSNFIHNYMDYSGGTCANMFTAGQKTRMIASLTTRASFLEENGNLSLTPVSSPTVDFIASNYVVCTGGSVNLFSTSSCLPNTYLSNSVFTDISYKWTLTNGVNSQTSTLINPSFTFANTGVYDVTLEVTTTFGTSSLTKNGLIVVAAKPKNACTPTSTNQGNFWYTISNVSFNTINNKTSKYINTPFNDFTCTNGTVVDAGKSYTISIAGHGTDYKESIEAYIDYNNNGTFEVGELIISGFAPLDTVTDIPVTISQSITIPVTATTNQALRMRVIGEANTISAQERACAASYFVADVEDYTVYINPVSNCATPVITLQPTIPNATCAGVGSQQLSVTATGTTLSYKWRKNGVVISNNTIYSGATSATLTISKGTTSEAGNYDVVVTESCGSNVTSTAVAVTINASVTSSVTIASSDADNSICSGINVTFTANPVNGGTPTYVWKLNGNIVPNQSAKTFVTNSLIHNDQVAVEMSSSLGCLTATTVFSNSIKTAIVSFNPSVQITSSDLDNIICSKTTVLFTATSSNSGQNPLYKWKLNGVNIPSATSTTYTTTSLNSNDEISVELTSQEVCASPKIILSNKIVTQVNNLPTATIAGDSTRCVGDPASSILFSGASGKSPYTFNYSKNGINGNINGATEARISAPTVSDGQFSYSLNSVTDANGCSRSYNNQQATVTILPVNSTTINCDNSNFNSLVFSWSAVTSATAYQLSYKINKGSIITLPNVQNLSYTLNSLNLGDTVSFTITPIGSGCFSPSSNTFYTRNCTKPVLTKQPKSVTICEGNEVTFTVSYNLGNSVEWEFLPSNGGSFSKVISSASISGEATTTLKILSNSSFNGISYRAKISDVSKYCFVYSDAAVLTVEDSIPSSQLAFSASTTEGCIPLTVNFALPSFDPNAIYVWNFGDGKIDTLNVQSVSYTYVSDGIFDVSIIANPSECATSFVRANYIDANNCANLSTTENKILKVYPIPSNNFVHIDNLPSGYTHLTLIDVAGKRIFTKEIQGVNEELNVSNYSPASYLIELSGDYISNKMIPIIIH
jgi:hypothetical protein